MHTTREILLGLVNNITVQHKYAKVVCACYFCTEGVMAMDIV